MYFNRFQNFDIIEQDIPVSLRTVANMFDSNNLCTYNGYIKEISWDFRDYSRLFRKIKTEKKKVDLYNFTNMLYDMFESNYFLQPPYYREEGNGNNHYTYYLDFSGYMVDGELYNPYGQCEVRDEPQNVLYTEFRLNRMFHKVNNDNLLQKFLNNQCKDEI